MKKGINSLKTIRHDIEALLPMTLGSLALFLCIGYFVYVVVKTTQVNYLSNQQIAEEEARINELEDELRFMKFQINYFKTTSFKEKEAREKLGYRAPGEKVVSLPLDKPEEKVADGAIEDEKIRVPNQHLWWAYFFGE
ncbi:MAG: Septum formation initiator [bacterium ADurb.Bin400]|nr:MAG: Septum formation initiator [bacterium ADurb.Bin400]